MTAADSAVFWVEYVLRHGGAHHLRSAATQLSWYQLALLDILAAIVAVVVILFLVLRKLLSLVCGRKGQKNVSTKEEGSRSSNLTALARLSSQSFYRLDVLTLVVALSWWITGEQFFGIMLEHNLNSFRL
ncbi:UDP-glucuronosyltransferase 1-1 [Homalodisca vitripennis]|nr:UDP-glucuronosyltransferase 1-1 [Homalodisca vitripennis]